MKVWSRLAPGQRDRAGWALYIALAFAVGAGLGGPVTLDPMLWGERQTRPFPDGPPSDDWLDARQVAEALGIPRRTVTTMMKRMWKEGYRQIKPIRGGRGRGVHLRMHRTAIGDLPVAQARYKREGYRGQAEKAREYQRSRDPEVHRRNGRRGGRAARHVRGEAHGRAYLTEGDVRRLRAEHERGVSAPILSEQTGISIAQVRRILRGASWSHVT